MTHLHERTIAKRRGPLQFLGNAACRTDVFELLVGAEHLWSIPPRDMDEDLEQQCERHDLRVFERPTFRDRLLCVPEALIRKAAERERAR